MRSKYKFTKEVIENLGKLEDKDVARKFGIINSLKLNVPIPFDLSSKIDL